MKSQLSNNMRTIATIIETLHGQTNSLKGLSDCSKKSTKYRSQIDRGLGRILTELGRFENVIDKLMAECSAE